MTNTAEITNPYLPSTTEEIKALKRFLAGAEHYIPCRVSFAAGLQSRPQPFELTEEKVSELWASFVEADLEIDRGYPEASDAFIAGYRVTEF